ncbi:MAG TPA: APC family permease [Baekduia sp.]|nr:APC family permease [Baekduia sp.]
MASQETAPLGLKKDAVNFISSVVIGVASTAPGYSLAATLGFIVAAVGLQSPAILWLAFVPMLLVATAYLFMNKADPDCGTSFAWVGKAMGPWTGWLTGWAIIVADIVVMANLAQIAGLYSVLLYNDIVPTDIETTTTLVTSIGVVWIAVMAFICWKGTELSATTQRYLLSAEVLTLSAFAVVALYKVYAGDALDTSIKPELSWFSPFAIDSTDGLVAGVLLAIFIYWGWDSAVTVNEETTDDRTSNAPGKSAIWSTIILVLIYVIVGTAAVAFAGTEQLADAEEVFDLLGTQVFGTPWNIILVIAVLTSAAASTQTTILPTARTSLSMARVKAAPSMFGTIHPRNLTPSTSTIWMGVLSILWYVGLTIVSENILFDSLAALGLMIAFYYGLSGFACCIYYRRAIMNTSTGATAAGIALAVGVVVLVVATLLESWFLAYFAFAFFVIALVLGLLNARSIKAFLLIGVAPAAGAVTLTYVFFKSCSDLSDPVNSESGDSWLGVGPPLVIGASFLLLGVILMLIWASGHPTFFRSKPTTFDGDLSGTAASPPTVV